MARAIELWRGACAGASRRAGKSQFIKRLVQECAPHLQRKCLVRPGKLAFVAAAIAESAHARGYPERRRQGCRTSRARPVGMVLHRAALKTQRLRPARGEDGWLLIPVAPASYSCGCATPLKIVA